jgi:hypothetical protein
LRELGVTERLLPASRKLEEAQKAYEEARGHRREMDRHKRAQRQAMQRFDLFKADLEAMGIQVVIESPTHPVRIEPPQTSHTSSLRRNSDDRSSV